MAAGLEAMLAETPAPPDAPAASDSSPGIAGGTEGPATASPTTAPEPTPTAPDVVTLYPEVISTSVWAGGHDPVILRATDNQGGQLDGSVPLEVQLTAFDGTPQGAAVTAVTVLPEGESVPYFVATLDIPAPGAWKLRLTAGDRVGDVAIQALDPGATATLGGRAPDIDTPTLADVGGVVRAVTTQPNPDLRMSQTSTADARAAGKPYVIVIDSARFRVSAGLWARALDDPLPARPLARRGVHPSRAVRLPDHHPGARALGFAHGPAAEHLVESLRAWGFDVAGHRDALDLRR